MGVSVGVRRAGALTGTLAFPMLSRLDLRGRPGDAFATALARPDGDGEGPLEAVREIIADVRKWGDDALRELTARFDGVELDELRVPRGDLTHALATLAPGFREALEFSRDQILAYHRTQVEDETRHEREGIVIRNLVRPVDLDGC
jgi:histidinol dehydrogenase